MFKYLIQFHSPESISKFTRPSVGDLSELLTIPSSMLRLGSWQLCSSKRPAAQDDLRIFMHWYAIIMFFFSLVEPFLDNFFGEWSQPSIHSLKAPSCVLPKFGYPKPLVSPFTRNNFGDLGACHWTKILSIAYSNYISHSYPNIKPLWVYHGWSSCSRFP